MISEDSDPITVLLALIGYGLLGLVVLLSLAWLYRDAERRNQTGCLMTILVALFAWPLGLIVWLLARPPLRKEVPLDIAMSCPTCGYSIPPRVYKCPHCENPRDQT